MATKFIDNNGIVNFDSILGEEDIKLNPIIYTNPTPVDETCDCCGRHLSELKPFGKAGDPLVGDFDGELFVNTFRTMFPFNKKVNGIVKKYLKDCNTREKAKDKLVETFSEEDAEGILIYEQGYGTIVKSFECRDCIVLDNNEYHKKLKRMEQESEDE